MDSIKAEELFKQVKGKKIEEITIEKLIDHGKSAAVFQGIKNDELFAIKIFDNEIVRRDDFEIHQERIKLELSLKEHKIPGLVKILGGGERKIAKTEYYYIIMEYIEGKNLKKYIESEKIDIHFIKKVANTLIDVTENLLKSAVPLVHRDIKPENIMVSKNNEIILMDLGVMKIVNNPSMTDINKKEFLGTLKYAPPEFLAREEKDNEEGWRAINIYQIGAVLHDLIMKKELFSGIEPYTKLVMVIKDDMPSIISNEYPADLIQLTRDMLQKNWKNRLSTNPISKIKLTLEKCSLPKKEQENVYDFIQSQSQEYIEKIEGIEKIERSNEEKHKNMVDTNDKIWRIIDECFNEKSINDITDKIEKTEPFKLDLYNDKIPMHRYKFYEIKGKFISGFFQEFLMLFVVENNESSYCKISLLGIIPDYFAKIKLNEPQNLMYILFTEEGKPLRPENRAFPPKVEIPPCSVFEGIVELEDNSLKDIISNKIALVNKDVFMIMRPYMRSILEERRNEVEGRHGDSFNYITKNIFITVKDDRHPK